MSKIPTAEEFSKGVTHHLEIPKFAEVLKTFAKLHVQAALEAAYQNTIIEEKEIYDPLNGDSWNQYIVNKDSVLNAYSLDNIK